jgi:hypothetical protein
LSVSYDRVLQIVNKTTNAVCEQYRADNVVCPPILQKGLFTVAAADNIDHNLSSGNSTSSFHGTGISLMQLPAKDFDFAHEMQSLSFDNVSDAASDIILPTSYSEISPCVLPSADPVIPASFVGLIEDKTDSSNDEMDWLHRVKENVDGNGQDFVAFISSLK